MGAFNIVRYDDENTNTNEDGDMVIENGVGEVRINMNVIGEETGIVGDEVLSVINTYFNITNDDDDLSSIVSFIGLCVPNGTTIGGSTNWAGYAFLNSYLSVYNDIKCLYPSLQMHELGHNIGLSHSGNEMYEYGDESCFMGLSSDGMDGPKICFDSVKSWELGWYKSSHLTLDANNNNNFYVQTPKSSNNVKIASKDYLYYDSGVYNIIGIAEYQSFNNKNGNDEDKYYTMIQFINVDDGFDY